ncbi:MAG: hypothetical protein K0R99_4240 [Microbacterium sp.]|jgi:uncharacterized membrane protein YqjE|uniref:hypothetical protein n=1 Tax=Microbacterium sp. TaxID=51671 RepID=UPI002633A26F|nr:hypothetical protein [Microbacterium sp.]MDF2562794.1 hypothetical protein [Microbacterium sp.]
MSGRTARRRSGRTDAGLDPTLVTSQPALRSSSGTIWLIVAALFAIMSLVPLIAIAVDGGPAESVALVTATLVVGLLLAMLILRWTVRDGLPRLRALAGCFLGMALITLVGMVVCVMIIWTPLTR